MFMFLNTVAIVYRVRDIGTYRLCHICGSLVCSLFGCSCSSTPSELCTG
jgi:hypothetical protein